MTEIQKVHEGYYFFHLRDVDDNVIEVTGGYNITYQNVRSKF